MTTNNKNGILTDTGTGEVEILHFKVAGQHYAINVIKVKEILNIDNISKLPNAHSSIMGLSLIRGEVISIVDMMMVLENRKINETGMTTVLVCEFNTMKIGFAIDEVVSISRISWGDIIPANSLAINEVIIGNIAKNDMILMLLDFEKIVMDISPACGISIDRLGEERIGSDRSSYKLVVTDDSVLIRQTLKDSLIKAGVTDLKFFNDGQSALDYFIELYERLGDRFMEETELLITDIEMPRLDGHTLTRRLKEHHGLKKMPIVIFSSLITNDLIHKGEQVGADAQMSKPEVGKLVDLIDGLIDKIRR